MALLSKLKDTTFSKFKGTKPTGPNTLETKQLGKGFSEGTYQNYLVNVASETKLDPNDNTSFPIRSTKQ